MRELTMNEIDEVGGGDDLIGIAPILGVAIAAVVVVGAAVTVAAVYSCDLTIDAKKLVVEMKCAK
jgi:tartrate dehydratase alpha subunit/fumarate hydratase class I-like protein